MAGHNRIRKADASDKQLFDQRRQRQRQDAGDGHGKIGQRTAAFSQNLRHAALAQRRDIRRAHRWLQTGGIGREFLFLNIGKRFAGVRGVQSDSLSFGGPVTVADAPAGIGPIIIAMNYNACMPHSPSPFNPHHAAESVACWPAAQGFELVGIAPAQPATHSRSQYRRHGFAAGPSTAAMEYLARDPDGRLDLPKKFPWVKSILCVALAYWSPEALESTGDKSDEGRIARYAWGRDYHKVIEAKLKRLEKSIRALFEKAPDAAPAEPLQIRAYCDTGPILERELAVRAGLGWIGKHTLLIHPRHGSWFLLGELLLSLELTPDDPMGDHCGTCQRCIEACPTHAITPHAVDATRCISYQTLENRGTIPADMHAPMRQAGFIVGCDICQEVCPFNRQPLPAQESSLAPREPAPSVSLQTILAWEEKDWDQQTRGRAFRRTKLPMFQRNARILRDHQRPQNG